MDKNVITEIIVDDIGEDERVDIVLRSKLNDYSSLYSVTDVKSRIEEFSSYFSGTGRLQLLYANKSENEELIFLLLNMKKQLKHVLTELGKFRNKKDYNFNCSVCNEKITAHQSNFWEDLQDHEHFEELYSKFLTKSEPFHQENNKSCNQDIEEIAVELNSMDISINTDDNECDNDNNNPNVNYGLEDADLSEDQVDEKNINSFRFNFVPSYDKIVQSKLYPEKTVQALRKFDPTNYPTVVLVGPFRAACLLCNCDLVSRNKSRMSRQFFLEHISGNRHLRQASLSENVNALINFHETWLNKQSLVQAHQVYFRPESEISFRCVLCEVKVPNKAVEAHIFTEVHKLKVIDSYEKNINCFYLLDLQMELYGIELEPKEEEKKAVTTPSKNREKSKNMTPKNERRNNGNQSNATEKTEESPHNIIKSVENSTSKVLLEQLPHRYKKHSQFFSHQGGGITCKICNAKMSANIPQVILHILNKSHLDLSKTPTVAHSYYCEVCNLKILDEFVWIKHFAEASKWHAKLPESRRQKTAEYECTKCCTVIFGDELSLSRHLYTKGLRRKPAEIKLAKSVLKIFKNKESIELEAARLLSEANKTLECNDATMECCRRVEEILATTFNDCKAYPFGSRISGLGDQKSDLDLFLDTGDMYSGCNRQDSLSQIQIVRKVHGVMCRVRDEFQDVVQIPTARTPIVKFHHKQTNIDCDLSFRHGLSVENTKFLRYCFDLQPISQSFILMLKFWSHQNNLSEYVTTYALAIMAIFYLQTKGYLLSVKKLRELSHTNGLTIGGWETVTYNLSVEEVKKHIVPYSGSVVELLKEFFVYYSKFLYDIDVICPLLGKCIKKKDFDDKGKNLPPEMNSYRAQLKSEEPELFRNTTSMCIQDPFDLSHNLTKALQIGTLKKFRMLCEMSYKTIESL